MPHGSVQEERGAANRRRDWRRREHFLGKPAPWWSGVVVSLKVRDLAFVAFSWWGEHITRLGCLFLAHQNFKPRAGPRKVFTHSSRRVSLYHCLYASIFERTLGQVRLSAATVRLDDNKLSVLHSNIIRPDER